MKYVDRFGNVWCVEMMEPYPMPIHEGIATHHWQVSIESADGGAVEHGHQNLAEAIAQAVAKADWLRR